MKKKTTAILMLFSLAAFSLTGALHYGSNLTKPDTKSSGFITTAPKNAPSKTEPSPKTEITPSNSRQSKLSQQIQIKYSKNAQKKTANDNRISKINTETRLVSALMSDKGRFKLKPAVGLSREVVGYYAEDWVGDTASLNSVKNYGQKMAGIAAFSFRLRSDGTLHGTTPSIAVKKAHSSGGAALALIHNYVDGGFNRSIVHNILVNSGLRSKTIGNILSVVKKGGFDGVNIDFENIGPKDRKLFNQFIKELTQVFHKNGYLVTVSVPAKTYDAASGWGGAFDYKVLGGTVDRVMLMTYDEHWFGGSPGPVASIGWVEQVIKYAVSQISADKVLLGLGVYGYEWEPGAGRSVRSLPASKALRVASQHGAEIKWDNRAQVPYFYYWPKRIKRVVWFESNNSVAFKMNLVNKYDLAGVAIWRLGFEDKGFWNTVNKKFGVRQ